MKKIILSLFFIIFIISCSQGDNIDVLKKTSPISINPLVNFTSFYNELEPSEQDCLLSEFSGKNEIINFVSDNSIPSQKLSDCIGQNTNFRILQGLFISRNIQLNSEEKSCLNENSLNEKFDYLGETFGSPIFTYSLGSLFCLNQISRTEYQLNLENFIENESIVKVLPNDINSLECISMKTSNQISMDALNSIYINSGAFPVQIISLLPHLIDCSKLPDELLDSGIDDKSSICLSEKLALNFSSLGNNFLLEIPKIILDIESCNIDSEKLLNYFGIDFPSSEDELDITEIIQNESITDERFICLSSELELSDVLEFLYTGVLSDKAMNVANDCGISKEEIEKIDLSEIIG
tara:strand:- start:5979 stop:7031 length:1053 start_codon:yes stop_codon:yes gene_type:complete